MHSIRRSASRGGNVVLTPFFAALAAGLFFAVSLHAQTEESRTLEFDGGGRVTYTLRTHPADAHVARPAGELAPTSALDAAKLLNLHLSTGDIEEAALLSNAPRQRFEVLRDYRESVGEEEFKRVFAQYFYAENRLLAEIAIGKHRLLIWDLKDGASRIAGQFFVEIEGRYLMDDVPGETRTSLRRILDAWRSGTIRP
ncbi:MAG: hypothetical protein AABM33_03735 [Pseudomonadota bacterium]